MQSLADFAQSSDDGLLPVLACSLFLDPFDVSESISECSDRMKEAPVVLER